MAKTPHHKSARGKSKSSTKGRATEPKLERPLKTTLTRKGMSPQRLLDAAGTISVKSLYAMEKAIEVGCERVETHGE